MLVFFNNKKKRYEHNGEKTIKQRVKNLLHATANLSSCHVML